MDNKFDYSVRIAAGNIEKLEGSGVLFIKDRENKKALLFTCAHVINNILKEREEERIYLVYTDVDREEQTDDFIVRICRENTVNQGKLGDVYIHPNYNDSNHARDLAIIILPWRDWMEKIPLYYISNPGWDAFQSGKGFPGSMNKDFEETPGNQSAGRDEVEGKVINIVKKGYTLRYPSRSDEEMITRYDNMGGFSGTGLFEERVGERYLMGMIFYPGGENTAGNILWAAKATWLCEIDEELRKFLVEDARLKQTLAYLQNDCETQIRLSYHSTQTLKCLKPLSFKAGNSGILTEDMKETWLEPSLYTDMVDEENRVFSANENEAALLEKLRDINNTDKSTNRNLLLIGEGGIGKTATLLGSSRYLVAQGEIALYIPLRNMTAAKGINAYIQKHILKKNREAYDKLKDIAHKEQGGSPRVYFFLDGFNEVAQKAIDKIREDLTEWTDAENVRIIISSRRTLEESYYYGFRAHRITMKRLSWDKVEAYLQQKNVAVPAKREVSEILGIPLMLKLYTAIVGQNARDNISSDRRYRWKRDMEKPGCLLWDYIQCQIYQANKVEGNMKTPNCSLYELMVAAECFAPYIASKMNQEESYEVPKEKIIDWLKKGLSLFQESKLEREIKDRLFMEGQKAEGQFKEPRIFWLLVNKLNLLFYCSREEENGKTIDKMSFEHQDFQDILHYLYIEEAIEKCDEPFFLGALTDAKLPYDVITRMSEMLQIKAENMDTGDKGRNSGYLAENLKKQWEKLKKGEQSAGEYGIYNMVEIMKRMYQNNLSNKDFSGLDLRQARLSGTILSTQKCHANFVNVKIGVHTFSTEGHSAPITRVAYNNTGGKFASASYDKTVRIWGTETGECVAVLEGHTHYVRCVAWSPDDKWLATGGDDRKVILWDAYAYINDCQGEHRRSLTGHNGWIHSVDWSRDGKILASGDAEGMVYLWRKDSEKDWSHSSTIGTEKSKVSFLVWNPQKNDILAIGYANGTVEIYNVQEMISKKVLHRSLAKAGGLAWSPDGTELAVGYDDGILIWNIDQIWAKTTPAVKWQNGDACCEGRLTAEGNIEKIIWTKRCLFGVRDRKIFIWNFNKAGNNRQGEQDETIEYAASINGIAWSEYSKKLVSCSDDGSLQIWMPRNPTWDLKWSRMRLIEGNSLPVRCVTWSEDCSRLIAGYDDNRLRIWEIEKERCCHILAGHENRIKSLAWKGRWIASGSNDCTIRIWDVENMKHEAYAVNCEHGDAVNCVLWLPDGKRVVSGSDDGKIQIWDFTTGEKKWLKGHTDRVYCIALSPDGQMLVSGSNDRTLRFWSVEEGKEYSEKRITAENPASHVLPIRGVAWSMDENLKMVISGSNDRTLRRWHSETQKPWEENPVLEGHSDFVYCVAWNPKSHYVVSGSTDNTLYVWDAVNGDKVKHLTGHTNYAHAAAWSPDGNYISSASCDGTVRLWNATNPMETFCEKTFVALPFVNIIDCDFRGAEFETEELKMLVKMNGGLM